MYTMINTLIQTPLQDDMVVQDEQELRTLEKRDDATAPLQGSFYSVRIASCFDKHDPISTALIWTRWVWVAQNLHDENLISFSTLRNKNK